MHFCRYIKALSIRMVHIVLKQLFHKLGQSLFYFHLMTAGFVHWRFILVEHSVIRSLYVYFDLVNVLRMITI
jgi:hypothetical protein